MQPQHERDPVITLQQEIGSGAATLFDVVPTILRRVIRRKLWADRMDKTGKPFANFEAFVVHRLQEGLESTIEDLLAYCRKEPEVQAMIRGELAAVHEQGRPKNGEGKGNNITFSLATDRGTASTYTLRRLKRDAPELAARVAAGELSANAAAILAGFRQRTVTLPADPIALARAIIARHPEAAAEIERLRRARVSCATWRN